ncbi:MAG: HEAT repeat domain-containing protein [bacterium]
MKDFDVLLLNLAKVSKAVSFYPENHPTLINALKKMTEDISLFAKDADFIIEISKEGFSIKGQKFYPTHPILKDLAQSFTLRRVNKVVFHKGLIPEELHNFLKLLNMEVSALYSAGGLEVLIEDSGIRNIALSEVHLTKLLSKVDKQQNISTGYGTEGGTEGEKKPFTESKPEQKVSTLLTGSEAMNIVEREKDINDHYSEALETLRLAVKEKNVGNFLKGLKMTGDLLAMLNWQDHYHNVLNLLKYIADVKKADEVVEGIKREAERFIYNTLNESRLNTLVNLFLVHIEDKDNSHRITDIFSAAGEPAVEVLLERLTSANDIRTRRVLINEITKLGDIAFERVLYHLTDERWYVVRNMVTILGVFAKPESLPSLFEAAKHPDLRVRKEVIKSLARIKDPRVFTFLREILPAEHDDIRLLIIFSFGIMRSREAIDDIVNILENEKNLAIKKEALVALGRIGAEKTFNILRSYAMKKGFFKKAEHKMLRLAAINGLAEIRTAESAEVLEKLLKDSDDDIRDAAFEALQKVRVRAGA